MALISLGGCIGSRHYQDCVISFAAAMAVAILNWYFVARVAKTNPVAYFTAGLGAMLFIRTFSIIVHGLPIMLPTLAVSAVHLAGPAIIAAILSMRSENAIAGHSSNSTGRADRDHFNWARKRQKLPQRNGKKRPQRRKVAVKRLKTTRLKNSIYRTNTRPQRVLRFVGSQ